MPLQILLWKASKKWREAKPTLPPKKGGEGGVKTLPLKVDQAQCNYWLQRQEYTPQLQE